MEGRRPDLLLHRGLRLIPPDLPLHLKVGQWPFSFGYDGQYFVLYEGPENIPLSFLASVGTWAAQLHEEVLVYNQGFWQKDHALWAEIQKSSWRDVILKEEFKLAIQNDISRFFDSEAVYKDLAVPWKVRTHSISSFRWTYSIITERACTYLTITLYIARLNLVQDLLRACRKRKDRTSMSSQLPDTYISLC